MTRTLIGALLILSAACGGSDGPSGPEPNPAPQITNVNPNPVRADETLIISGQNLRAGKTPLSPSQTQNVEVVFDGTPFPPLSVENNEVQFRVPFATTPGNHTVAIRRAGMSSNSLSVSSEIYTATGTYRAEGTVALNSCLDFGIGDPVGTAVSYQVVITDSRPDATGRIGATPLTGTLSGAGSFNMSRTRDAITTRVEGNLLVTNQDQAGFSGRVSLSSSEVIICSIIDQVQAVRVTTTPTAKDPGQIFSQVLPLDRLEHVRRSMSKR